MKTFVNRPQAVRRNIPVLLAALVLFLFINSAFAQTNLQPELVLQISHSASVKAVAFSPDGQSFASGDESGLIRLWNPQTREVKRVLAPRAGAVLRLAFAPDGRTIAAGASDGRISVWRLAADAELFSIEAGVADASSFVFSADGKTLLAGGPLRVWDAQTGALQKTLEAIKGRVVFSPDRTMIAEVVAEAHAPEGVVYFYNLATPERKNQFKVSNPASLLLAFSPDGKLLASGGKEQTVQLWEVEAGRLLRVLNDRKNTLSNLAFVPASKLLLGWLASTEGPSGTGLFWDLETAAVKLRVNPERDVSTLAISADGSLLATASAESVSFYDIKTDQLMRTPVDAAGGVPVAKANSGVRPLSYSILDAETIIARSHFDTQDIIARREIGVSFFDIQTEKLRFSLSRPGVQLGYVELTRDGKQIITSALAGNKVYLWDAATGKYLREQADPQASYTHDTRPTIVSPDGKLIAVSEGATAPPAFGPMPPRATRPVPRVKKPVAPAPPTIKVMDAGKKTLKYVLRGVAITTQKNVRFSPDSRWIMGWSSPQQPSGWNTAAAQEASDKTTFFLWDAQTGRLKNSFSLKQPLAARVAFSADSKFVALEEDNAVSVVELNTGQLKQRYNWTSQTEVNGLEDLEFSPDSSLLAGTYAEEGEFKEVRVWNLETGKLEYTLRDSEQCGCKPALAFSPDGKYLAGMSAGGSVLWELRTGQLRRFSNAYNSTVRAMRFSSDSKMVSVPFSGLDAGESLRIFETASGRLLKTILVLPMMVGDKPASAWIAFTPEGFYTGSPEAARLIRWRVGAELFPAERFAE
jgi:WD40 repeat protein